MPLRRFVNLRHGLVSNLHGPSAIMVRRSRVSPCHARDKPRGSPLPVLERQGSLEIHKQEAGSDVDVSAASSVVPPPIKETIFFHADRSSDEEECPPWMPFQNYQRVCDPFSGRRSWEWEFVLSPPPLHIFKWVVSKASAWGGGELRRQVRSVLVDGGASAEEIALGLSNLETVLDLMKATLLQAVLSGDGPPEIDWGFVSKISRLG